MSTKNQEQLNSQELFAKIKSIFPPLDQQATKGQNGKIGVIGGSYEFSGPPFYSAMASLRVGTDMAHIFCPKKSATAIKSYSPDLIVHPVFESDQDGINEDQIEKVYDEWLDVIKKWQTQIYAWVIGPGLGHDKYINGFFPRLVRNLPENSVIVFDADGIHYLCNNPDLFKDLKRYKVVITPNKTQLALIQKTLGLDLLPISEQFEKQEKNQIEEFQHKIDLPFTLFIKGVKDVILGPKNFVISVQGGPKRSSNIGDILAGSVAACSDWDFVYGPALASIIVRMATKKAFEKQGRSLTAMGIITEIVTTIKILQTQPPYL